MRPTLPLALACLLTPICVADFIYVPSDVSTIQGAIDAASDGDEIVIAPGLYRELLDLGAKQLTLRSTNPADASVVAATIISADLNDDGIGEGTALRCVGAQGPETLIDGLTIRDGRASLVGGGLLVSDSSPTIRRCVLEHNDGAEYGGAIALLNSGAHIERCMIRDNAATRGAGVYATESLATIDACTIVSNTAVAGAGLYTSLGSPTITNSRLTGNSTLGGFGGGGIFVASGGIHASGCTLADNAAPFLAGADLHLFTNDPGVQIVNCVLWSPPFAVADASHVASLSASIVGGGNFAADVQLSDPHFVDADGADNDPTTQDDNDYHLAPGSPGIDAGDSPAHAALTASTLDLDGSPRFVDDPATPDTGVPLASGVIDIGAYEFAVGACSVADLADPLGQLDFSDVVAFLVAFASLDPSADLAAPIGQWDFSDVVAFLVAFDAGCP